eukprot:TRINITY_DN101_c0_g2_i3.p1 TRINITY_DN101_c0_g2~~TRINITY_DN101_c0_g2_i3.p1  ORF type:complete len:602 (+),score=284.51 TRINITY_DN101_c0_g2_i3:63-1868(+)
MVARAALLLCLAAASTTYAANADPVQCVKDLEDVVRDIGASFSDIGELVTHCKEKDSALCVQAIETYTDSLNELVDAVDKTGVDCGVESVECAADIDKAAAGLDEAIDNIAKAAENCKTSKFQCVVDLEHVGKGLEEALHGIFSARTSCKKAKKVKKALDGDCKGDLEVAAEDVGVVYHDLATVVLNCKEKNETVCIASIEAMVSDLDKLVEAMDTAGVDCGVESPACASDINAAAQSLTEAADYLGKAAEQCKASGSKFQCVVDLERARTNAQSALVDITKAKTDCPNKLAKKVKKAVKVDPEACIKDLETATHDASVFFRDIKTVVTTCKEHDEDTCTAAIDTLADAAQELVDEVDQAGEDCGYESEACAASVDKAAAGLDSAVKDLGKAAENCKKGGSKFQCVVDLEETAKDVETAFEGIISARTDCKKAKKVKKAVKVDPEACIKDLETLDGDCKGDLEVAAEDVGVVYHDLATVVLNCKEKNETVCIASIEAMVSDLDKLVEAMDTAGVDCGVESPACASDINAAAQSLTEAADYLGKAAEQCKASGSKFQCVVDLEHGAKDVEAAGQWIIKARDDCKESGRKLSARVKGINSRQF